MAFPNQKLTRAQKIEEYGSIEDYAKEILESLNNFRNHSAIAEMEYDIWENYNLMEGRFNKDTYSTGLEVLGAGDFNMPIDLEHYDIMSPKFELLRGEEIKRKFGFKVIQTGKGVVSEIQKKRKEDILNALEQTLIAELEKRGMVPQEQDPSGKPLPTQAPDIGAIDKYYRYEYRDMIEVEAANLLEYFRYYLDLDDVFSEGWAHYLKSAREIYWTGIVQGEPVIRAVDPRYCAFELSKGNTKIEDASWFIEWRYLTASDVYDEFFDVLDEDEVEKIEQLKGSHKRDYQEPMEYNWGENVFRVGSDTIIKVVRAEWIGLRKVGFVTYTDEEGQPQEKLVDEEYTLQKGEEVEWHWINERWECTKIGDDIFKNARPVPNQDISLDNPSKCKLGYVGKVGSYSLVSKMKVWQIMYNIMMYHLKMDFSTAIGQVGIFDIAQMPRTEGFDPDKIIYYMKVFKMMFINTKEEGAQGSSNFNTHKTLDLSLKESIQHRMGMLNFIEEKLASITGITPQRQGQIQASETVGGVERSVNNSSYITEYLFEDHHDTKRMALERLLDEAKVAFKDGKKAQYVSGDLGRVLIDIKPGSFNNAELGVFIEDSSKDDKAINMLREWALGAIQAGNAELADLVAVLKSDNLTFIEKRLEESQDKARERAMQEKQAEMEALKEVEDKKMALEKFKQDNENARNFRDNDTKLKIAGLSSQSQAEDANRNGVLDTIERSLEERKLNIEDAKRLDGKHLAEKQMKLDKEQNDKENKLKEKELEIKKKQAAKKPSSGGKK